LPSPLKSLFMARGAEDTVLKTLPLQPAGRGGPNRPELRDVIIEIPYPRLSRASIVKQVIRLAVAIKVRHAHDGPADRKSGGRTDWSLERYC